MLAYLSSSIWASPAQTLVNTVNVDIPLGYSREYLQNVEETVDGDVRVERA